MENETPKTPKKLNISLKKLFIPLAPGTVINFGIYVFFKSSIEPSNLWILLLIYCVTFIPQAIDSYTEIRLAEINATRQVDRDNAVRGQNKHIND